MAKPKRNKKRKFRNLSIQERLDEDRIDQRHILNRESLSDRYSRWRERVNEDEAALEYDPSLYKGTILGTVINMRSGHHFVKLDDSGKVVDARVKGTLKKGIRNTTTVVAPGDKVHVELYEDDTGVIVGIVPRRTALSRPAPLRSHLEDVIVANVEKILIVSSLGGPAFWPELVDRYLVYSEYYQLDPLVVVNKIDQATPGELDEIRALYTHQLGYQVLFTSTITNEGVADLAKFMQGHSSVIVGLSGVGKSSLLNAIQPDLSLKVRSVNEAYGGEGKHATRSTTLHPIDIGGFVADTPGIREFGLWDLTPEEVDYYFVEFRDFISECKFSDCTHHQEPGCAILQSVEEGIIAESRYKSFLVLFEETDPAIERPY